MLGSILKEDASAPPPFPEMLVEYDEVFVHFQFNNSTFTQQLFMYICTLYNVCMYCTLCKLQSIPDIVKIVWNGEVYNSGPLVCHGQS